MTSPGLKRSLDAVAVVEAVKGAAVLLVGFGLLGLLHRDPHALALEIVSRMHLNPAQGYPLVFVDLLSSLSDARLWFFAAMALLYSALRFTEAYGLWHDRAWAEWLALLSTAVYLPVEIYEILERWTLVRLTALVMNLAVFTLIGLIFLQRRRKE